MRSVKSLVPWIWTGVVTVATVVLFLDEVLNQGTSIGTGLAGVPLTVLFTFLGALIAVRQPGNRIAWLLLVIGFGLLLIGVLTRFTGAEPEFPSFLDLFAIVLDNWVGLNLIFYPLVLIPFIFPTGRFFTRRQVWVGWVGAIMVPTSLLVALFAEKIGPPFQSGDQPWRIANPIGFLPTVALDFVLSVWGMGLLVLAIGGVWSLIIRYGQSSLVVKAQIRWMLFASLFLAVGFAFIIATDTDSTISGVFVALAFASIPVSITIAITRYKLFEIDRIISRTLGYAIVVGLLAAAFFGLITLITNLLPAQNSLAVAGSTLAVAALFNPLRKRVQQGIDKRFNRSRYQATLVSERFAAELSRPHTVSEIVELWNQTVKDSLQPEASGLWLSPTYSKTSRP